jgi:hypothetical protein
MVLHQLADHQGGRLPRGLCAWAGTRDRPPKAEGKISEIPQCPVNNDFTAESAEDAELKKIPRTQSQIITHISKPNVPTPKIWKLEFRIYLGFGISDLVFKNSIFSLRSRRALRLRMKGECHETG